MRRVGLAVVAAALVVTASAQASISILAGASASVVGGQFYGDAATFDAGETPNAQCSTTGYSATVSWGDGTSPTTGTVALQSSPAIPAGYCGYAVIARHFYAQASTTPYAVVVSVTDPTSTVTMITGGITVVTGTPVQPAGPPVTPETFAVTGSSTTVAAVAGIPVTATLATISSTGSLPATPFSASINWGDGRAATVGVVTETAANTFSVSGSHTYAGGGSFTATATITDLREIPLATKTATSTVSVTPAASAIISLPTGAVCVGSAGLVVHLDQLDGVVLKSARVWIGNHIALSVSGRHLLAPIKVKRLVGRHFILKIVAHTSGTTIFTLSQTYHSCAR